MNFSAPGPNIPIPPPPLDSAGMQPASPRIRHAATWDLDDLVLCARTLPQASFTERVRLAEKHGFTATSLLGPEHQALATAGVTDAEVAGAIRSVHPRTERTRRL
ncbi:MAG: hypothetical protein KDB21_01405 [Acidimicrobiales bacterium]|nr:hypothetical protein [Acidimicrobiales bacterium]